MKAAPVSFPGWPSSASYKKAGGFDSRIGKSRFQGEWKQTPEPEGSARRKGIGASARSPPPGTRRGRPRGNGACRRAAGQCPRTRTATDLLGRWPSGAGSSSPRPCPDGHDSHQRARVLAGAGACGVAGGTGDGSPHRVTCSQERSNAWRPSRRRGPGAGPRPWRGRPRRTLLRGHGDGVEVERPPDRQPERLASVRDVGLRQEDVGDLAVLELALHHGELLEVRHGLEGRRPLSGQAREFDGRGRPGPVDEVGLVVLGELSSTVPD